MRVWHTYAGTDNVKILSIHLNPVPTVSHPEPHILVHTTQALSYASRLRIGPEYSESERAERVRVVTQLLELDTCSHVLVGDATIRGISGGQ
eukprot:14307-Eustigmatos_ZCMA.PRE.1